MQKGRYRMEKEAGEEEDGLSWSSVVPVVNGGCGRLFVVVVVEGNSPVDRPYHVPKKKTIKTAATPSPNHLLAVICLYLC